MSRCAFTQYAAGGPRRCRKDATVEIKSLKGRHRICEKHLQRIRADFLVEGRAAPVITARGIFANKAARKK